VATNGVALGVGDGVGEEPDEVPPQAVKAMPTKAVADNTALFTFFALQPLIRFF
jgi:hypothetical protein